MDGQLQTRPETELASVHNSRYSVLPAAGFLYFYAGYILLGFPVSGIRDSGGVLCGPDTDYHVFFSVLASDCII